MSKVSKVLTLLMFAVCLAIGPPGCTAEEARKNAERMEAAADAALIQKARIDGILETIQAGNISDDVAIQALKQVLSPEHAASIDQAISTGQDAIRRAAEISTALGLSAQAMKTQAEQFRASIADAAADDNVTAQSFTAIVQGMAPVLGPWGLALGAIATGIGAWFGRKSGIKKGEVQGAEKGFKAGEASGAAAVASIADIDGEVMHEMNIVHPHLVKTVNEFRDWPVKSSPVPS